MIQPGPIRCSVPLIVTGGSFASARMDFGRRDTQPHQPVGDSAVHGALEVITLQSWERGEKSETVHLPVSQSFKSVGVHLLGSGYSIEFDGRNGLLTILGHTLARGVAKP